MKLVVVESPFSGNTERNVTYARAALRDCLVRGESPYASHLLYTQPGVLDDDVPAERELGMRAGFAWNKAASLAAVYTDLGISGGMNAGIECHQVNRIPIEYRQLQQWRIVGSCALCTQQLYAAENNFECGSCPRQLCRGCRVDDDFCAECLVEMGGRPRA